MDKKKKTGLIAGICVAVVCVLVIIGCIIGVQVNKKNAEPVLAKTGDDSIRIATMNIYANGEPSMKKINTQLNKYAVDVVGFQEVDRNTKRNNYDMLGKLAEFGVYPYNHFIKTMDFDGDYGIGMASAFEIKDSNGAIFNQKGTSEDMAWEMIEIEKGGRTIHVYNTHFEWTRDAMHPEDQIDRRHKQILEMVAILDNDPCPYKILTGDFNTDQDIHENDPFLANYNLTNGYEGNWIDTFNEEDPCMKVYAIDQIVTTKNLKLKDVQAVRNDKISDHSMLYAEFEFLD